MLPARFSSSPETLMPRPPSLRTMASSSSLTSSLTNTVLRFLIFGTVRYVSRYSSSEALRCLPLVLLLTGSSGSGGVSFLPASPDTSSATAPDGITVPHPYRRIPPGTGFHHDVFPTTRRGRLRDYGRSFCLRFRIPPFSSLSFFQSVHFSLYMDFSWLILWAQSTRLPDCRKQIKR